MVWLKPKKAPVTMGILLDLMNIREKKWLDNFRRTSTTVVFYIVLVVSSKHFSGIMCNIVSANWQLPVCTECAMNLTVTIIAALMCSSQRWEVHGTVVGRAAAWQRCGCHPVRHVLWRVLQRQQDVCKFTLKQRYSVKIRGSGISVCLLWQGVIDVCVEEFEKKHLSEDL